MSVTAPNRLQKLIAESDVTGIDFVRIGPDHDTLEVYFLKSPALVTPWLTDISTDQISILKLEGTEQPRGSFRIKSLDWRPSPLAPEHLEIALDRPGDWSNYILRIDDPRIDPYFNGIPFSFKVECERDVDCAPDPHKCPPEKQVDFPVDYQARDFWSLRRALMEFAAQRYPDWEDRGREADAIVMLAEVMSAVGDEFAYYQDRIAREAYLETATQRRSIRRHARLVDYQIHDGLGARTWLDFTIKTGQSVTIPAGFQVWAVSDTGGRIYFEVGHGLRDILEGHEFAVDSGRNSFRPHVWDEDDTCLPVGTTELFIEGDHETVLALDEQIENDELGRWMLLRTKPTDASLPARSWLVRVTEVTATRDPVFDNEPVTRLRWKQEQALPFELDMTVLEVRGNLVPAVAGRTQTRNFRIRPPTDPCEDSADEPYSADIAIERAGPNGSVAYMATLPDPDGEGLVWLGDDPRAAVPEIALFEEDAGEWNWKRSLLGVQSSQPHYPDFTLDDGEWGRVTGYRRVGREIVHADYRRDGGVTVRFGDGEFGRPPARGTVFHATYRLGNGARGNLAADSLTAFDPGFQLPPSNTAAGDAIESVANPRPAEGGRDPEVPDKIRQLAPFAFQSETYRAVTERDYAEAAERLPWVQRAGARFRWTGSWLTSFVTPDPLGSVQLEKGQRREVEEQLDRFRQTGRQVHVMKPRYADLDLEITICVEPAAYPGEVKDRVLQRLLGDRGTSAKPGFFAADNFTFGTPLHRSAIEAAIHDVPSVRAVMGMTIARRGWFSAKPFVDPTYSVATDEVIRIDNDATHPDRGSVKLFMKGGA